MTIPAVTLPRAAFLCAALFCAICVSGAASARKSPQAERWRVACEGESLCEALIELRTPRGQRIVKLWIGSTRNENKRYFLGAIMPLGVHIPGGLWLSFDGGKTPYRKLKVLECLERGCRAIVAMDSDLSKRMRANRTVSIIFTDWKSRKNLSFNLPLTGFETALKELVSRF